MRIRLALLASLPLLALSLAAHASTLTYNVSGALQTGTYTGTFSVDSSSGLITGGLFTANGRVPHISLLRCGFQRATNPTQPKYYPLLTMIHLDLQPEVEAQLTAKARARGIPLSRSHA